MNVYEVRKVIGSRVVHSYWKLNTSFKQSTIDTNLELSLPSLYDDLVFCIAENKSRVFLKSGKEFCPLSRVYYNSSWNMDLYEHLDGACVIGLKVYPFAKKYLLRWVEENESKLYFYRRVMIDIHKPEDFHEVIQELISVIEKGFAESVVLNYMYDDIIHDAQNINVARIGSKYFNNRKHLYRVFKQTWMMPPSEFINRVRLSQSISMMLSFKSSANYVGYSDQSHFIRAFKKEFSVLPGGLIREINKNADNRTYTMCDEFKKL